MIEFNAFQDMNLIPGTTVPFKAVSLRDQIRNAMDTGVVMESVPVSVAYDEDVDDYDPLSDIRCSRLDAFEYGQLSATDRKEASQPTHVVPSVTDQSESSSATLSNVE